MRNRLNSGTWPDRDPVIEPIIAQTSRSFVWRIDDYPTERSVWNQHRECELHLIQSSSGTVRVGDYIGPFEAGDLFLIGSDLPHDWVTPLDAGQTVVGRDLVLQFDPRRVMEASAHLPELGRLLPLFDRAQRGLSFHDETRIAVSALLQDVGRVDGMDRFSIFLKILSLLSRSEDYSLLSSAHFSPTHDSKAASLARHVLVYMMENCAGPLHLADLAGFAGMTESSFSRFFKRETGNTFSRHLAELRIAKACDLLARTDKPVTEICFEVGYINLSNFNRAFLRSRSVPPSQYRKRLRE